MRQDTINIDLKLPTRWEQLTEKQLRYLFGLFAQNFPAQQIKTYCLFRWSGIQVMHRYGKGWYCKFAKGIAVESRRTVLRGRLDTGLPRIWLVAGLRHRTRNASRQLGRHRPSETTAVSPMVFTKVLCLRQTTF